VFAIDIWHGVDGLGEARGVHPRQTEEKEEPTRRTKGKNETFMDQGKVTDIPDRATGS